MQDAVVKKKSTNIWVTDERIAKILNYEKRLSLAYGALDYVPDLILEYVADKIEILDLSHNRFQDLSFLEYFPYIQTLILDRNLNLDCKTLPKMENLEVLWLNNCNLVNITDWLQTLQVQCPKLKQLSMMCNPVGLTALNGVSDDEEMEYRIQVLKILPSLEYFDGIKITDRLRTLASGSIISIVVLEIKSFIEFTMKLHGSLSTESLLDEEMSDS